MPRPGGTGPGPLVGIYNPNGLIGTLKYPERIPKAKVLLSRAFDQCGSDDDRLLILNPLVGALADKNSHCSAASCELLEEMMMKAPKAASRPLIGALRNPERAVLAEGIFISAALMSSQIAYDICCCLTPCLGDEERDDIVKNIYRRIMAQDRSTGGSSFIEAVVRPVVGALADVEEKRTLSAVEVLIEAAQNNIHRTAGILSNALDDPSRREQAKAVLIEIGKLNPYEVSKVVIATSADTRYRSYAISTLEGISVYAMGNMVSALLHLSGRPELSDVSKEISLRIACRDLQGTVKAILANLMSDNLRPQIQIHIANICDSMEGSREYILSELSRLRDQ